MGTLQKFVEFAEKLEGEDRNFVEILLESAMASFGTDAALTPEQAVENARRMADTNPQYASVAEIDAVFGKPLPH
ncbi:hypothetical protein [Robiginitomaculum antarcticum]|uniref:hypothetical protein n=1 Tax=Robiginitomaculum antarcticum TaxID=437507 RepID=UPI000379C69D|nr:hypothetical protein [Robiginitomaculum antarcticum]